MHSKTYFGGTYKIRQLIGRATTGAIGPGPSTEYVLVFDDAIPELLTYGTAAADGTWTIPALAPGHPFPEQRFDARIRGRSPVR